MKIVDCRVNHMVNPIGFAMSEPVFSYVIQEAKGKRQSAAQIRVALDPGMVQIVADTGKSEEIDSLGYKLCMELTPCTRYYWTVTAWTDGGDEAASEVSYFETAKMEQPWTGRWITCNSDEPRHPIFCRELTVGSQIINARLYISGLGLYVAYINDERVGNEYLTPFCNDYDEWVQYQTYDVTELLKSEEKPLLAVELGNGWYKGRFGFDTFPDSDPVYGTTWKMIAELQITYADGRTEVIGTDDSWSVVRSNITASSIYDGEHRDDTLPELPVEQAVYLPEEEAAKLHLEARRSIPVLEHELLRPVALIDTPAGEKVFDLGQNMTGIFRLRVHEPAGTKVHVQVGEVLQEGNFYRDNLRSALAEYWYVSDGEEHVIEPQFTFYGYRYAKGEGISNLSIDDFTGVAVYSDVTVRGSLHTGHAKVNQLLSNILWGEKDNFLDVPTDCPQRDERMGWTADTQVFVPTALYFTDAYAFYSKFLYDLRREQAQINGSVPFVVPSAGRGGAGCSVWGDAATIMPWAIYQYYGDRTILEDCLGSMKAWVDYIHDVEVNKGGWGNQFHFGDWLALDNPAGGVDQVKGGTEDAFIAYVYYYFSADIVSRAAGILADAPQNSVSGDAAAGGNGSAPDGAGTGQEKVSADYRSIETQYRALADEVYQYIQDEYFTPNGRLAINTQTGYVLALYYNLTQHKDKALQSLLDLIHAKKNKFVTGFVGTPLIQKVLSANGQDELAYKLLLNEEFPGWLYEINLGATTVWERWNSMDENGKVSSTGMNSFNHYAYGSVGEWMWQTIAGIQTSLETPGFRKVFLRPVPNYTIGTADAAIDSPVGTWKVSWDVLDLNHVHLQVEVPFGASALLELPWAADFTDRELEPGSYEFVLETKKPLKTIFTVDTPIEELLSDPLAVQAIAKHKPELFQTPTMVQRFGVRKIAEQYGRPMSEEDIRAFNAMFEEI